MKKKSFFFRFYVTGWFDEKKIDLEKTLKTLSLIAKESLKQSFFDLTDNDRVPF